MAIMKAFWLKGPMSAREVQDALTGELSWASSTVRTMLERMRIKGLIVRNSVHGVAVYSPANDKVSVLGAVLKRLMRNVLEVRGELPASAFAGSEILTSTELEALHRLLNEEAPSK